MAEMLSSDQIEVLIDTLCKAFWYKRPFIDFLRRCGVSRDDLAQLSQHSTKKEFLRWLFSRFEGGPNGQQLMRDIAIDLANKSAFPELDPDQVRIAKLAIESLRVYFPSVALRSQQSPMQQSAPATNATREIVIDLKGFENRLCGLLQMLGSAEGGREFERWFIELAEAHRLSPKGKYSTSEREFDGSLVVDQIVYLLELKFTKSKSDAPDVSNFRDKVMGHASGTMGLFVSMNGFTENAISTASRSGSPIVLCDGAHLFRVFGGVKFDELVRRMRRHSNETGRAYLPAGEV